MRALRERLPLPTMRLPSSLAQAGVDVDLRAWAGGSVRERARARMSARWQGVSVGVWEGVWEGA
eukprot:6213133-Pleurochrysis_carterae.AAC.4